LVCNRQYLAAVDQPQVDDIDGNFRVVACGQHAPGSIFDRLGGDRPLVYMQDVFGGFETQGITVNAFNAVQVALDHDGIAATKLLGDGGLAALLDGNRRAVRNRDGRTIPADDNVLTRVTHD